MRCELEVTECHPVDLLSDQLVSAFLSVEVKIEGEPAPMPEVVLPQRRAALQRQADHFIHAPLVKSVEEMIERHVQHRRFLNNRSPLGDGRVRLLDR